MKMAFKKSLASIMSVVSLAMCVTSMSASASNGTQTDSYSKFYYYRNYTDCGCELTNYSGASRYAQVAMTVYTTNGTQYRSNEDVIAHGETIGCYYSGYIITGVEFYGTLYSGTTPHGTPLSYYHTTL